MTYRTVRRMALATATIVSLLPASSRAGTDTDQLTVTATVQSSCSLTGGTLSFGQYVSGQSSNLDATGSIDFANCAIGTLKFELDGGGSGNVNARQMSSGSNKLNYQIYRDSGRSSVWSSGANSKDMQLLAPQSGKIDVYGRIPSGQTPAAGSYSDIVTITMTF